MNKNFTQSLECKTKNQQKSTVSVNQMTELYVNRISLNITKDTIQPYFTENDGIDRHRMKIRYLTEDIQLSFPEVAKNDGFIYLSFKPIEDGIKMSIPATHSFSIIRAYFTYHIRETLKKEVYAIDKNFLNDTTFWITDMLSADGKLRAYKRFCIRVEGPKESPRMLVSYEGKSYVIVQPLSELNKNPSFDNTKLGRMIYKGVIYTSMKMLPKAASYHQEEIYAVSNKELGYSKPYDPHPDKLRYYYNECDSFRKDYLETEQFRAAIPHSAEWQNLPKKAKGHIPQPNLNYVFGGNHKSTDIYNGFLQYGPYQLPDNRKVNSFFIFHEKDRELVRNFTSYLSGSATKSGHGLNRISRLIHSYNKSFFIEYKNADNPLAEIRAKLAEFQSDPEYQAHAFVFSPHNALKANAHHHHIYHHIKEELLRHNILSQNIDAEKARHSKSLNYWIINIAIAMVAKMGGIPWKPDHMPFNEIIIGFGAFRSNNHRQKYIGSSFVFSNEGRFEEFDCFQSKESWGLAAQAEKALYAYKKKHHEVHGYSGLS